MDSPANKVFPSYSAALSACQGLGYSDAHLAEMVIEKSIIFERELKGETYLDPIFFRTLVPAFLASGFAVKKVLDFGGGGGAAFFVSQNLLGTNIDFQWAIVETEAMCRAAEKIDNQRLQFFPKISSAIAELGGADLVFTSSALQYHPEPLDCLAELVSCSARYLYITRTPFTSGTNSVVTVQESRLSENGPGALPARFEDRIVLYPVTFVPLEEVLFLVQQRYKIVFRMKEQHPKLVHGNDFVDGYYGLFCTLKD